MGNRSPAARRKAKIYLVFMKQLYLLFLGLVLIGHTHAQVQNKASIDAFTSRSGANTFVNKATHSVGFIQFPKAAPHRVTGNGPVEKAFNFINQNQSLLALRSADDAFQLKSTQKDIFKLDHVSLQQTYKGVPVYDGVLKFHFDRSTNITSVNGNYIPNIKINPVPTLSKAAAEANAIKRVSVTEDMQIIENLRAHKSELFFFQKGLAQGYAGPHHLVYEVEVRNDINIREYLFIDAHTGALVEQFSGIHSIDRKLYNKTIAPANLIWKEGDGPIPTDIWHHSELETSRHIYNLFDRTFGHTSFNGKDSTMITTHNNPTIFCPNANWNGVSANYCTNTASDDVVAHEWAHAYTEYTSGLIYSWQPGALNESFSDIWGETIDLLNNPYFDEEETHALRIPNDCNSSDRWLMGEKASAFESALRDMWNPNCKAHPGRVLDPLYHCSAADAGGVHINSGVPNLLFALLVDGGTYNGQTIASIGLTKAAHLMWRVQSNYLTKTSNFKVFAHALVAASNDLIGVGELTSLVITDGGPASGSGQTFTAADLEAVNNAIAATELLEDPLCSFSEMFAATSADCSGSGPVNVIFSADFESGDNGFVTSRTNTNAPNTWKRESNAAGNTSSFMHVDIFDSNICDAPGMASIQSPEIVIPSVGPGSITMSFRHKVSMEPRFDGGNIKYKINDGNWTLIPLSAFIINGYNTTLDSEGYSSDNPLFNQQAFSGPLNGDLISKWGETRIDLTSLDLATGQTVSFRWDAGWDCLVGYDGWYIDDIKIYACTEAQPTVQFIFPNTTVNEAQANIVGDCLDYVEKNISVSINKAPTAPVNVTLIPSGNPEQTTAKRGINADYSFEPAFVTLQAGQLTQNFVVRIYNDDYVEGDEKVTFTYSLDANGGDAYAASEGQSHTLTIKDDDIEPGRTSTTVLHENFNTVENLQWTTANGDIANNSIAWVISTVQGGLNGSPFAFINSDAVKAEIDELLISPEFSTAGLTDIQLTFEQYLEVYTSGFAEQAIVEVWNGTEWIAVDTQSQSGGKVGGWSNGILRTVNIPDEHANAAMKIRFRFKANWDYWWAIDEVKVTALKAHEIQTVVNSNDAASTYLGSNETVPIYDPTSGNLMAKIENLTSHDYGCITVEVDRAGTGNQNWVMGYKASAKTLKVTPTHPNPSGEYRITLYYTAEEVAGMGTINSVGKSGGSIANPTDGSWAEFESTTVFNTDFAYIATFDSGFSGFALSDALPVGPLPVKLLAFDLKKREGAVTLNWSTSQEENARSFDVEKSADATIWSPVGTVKASGTTNHTQHYRLTDNMPGSGKQYYRLKINDLDGKFEYSPIRSIDLGERPISIYPNPAADQIFLKLPTHGTISGVEMYNATGQKVFSKSGQGIPHTIDTKNFPTGTYTIRVLTGSGQHMTHKVLIVK